MKKAANPTVACKKKKLYLIPTTEKKFFDICTIHKEFISETTAHPGKHTPTLSKLFTVK